MNLNAVKGLALSVLCALGLSACSVTDESPEVSFETPALWAVLPFANATETPLAGQRAEAIGEAILRANGFADVVRYPPDIATDTLFDSGSANAEVEALSWARSIGARYALGGTVDEWRYKVGVDGEPAAGVALRVYDLQTERVIWSAVGGKSGWSRESLSGVGQKLLRSLMSDLEP